MNWFQKVLNFIPSIVELIRSARKDSQNEDALADIEAANRDRNTATVNFDDGVSNDKHQRD